MLLCKLPHDLFGSHPNKSFTQNIYKYFLPSLTSIFSISLWNVLILSSLTMFGIHIIKFFLSSTYLPAAALLGYHLLFCSCPNSFWNSSLIFPLPGTMLLLKAGAVPPTAQINRYLLVYLREWCTKAFFNPSICSIRVRGNCKSIGQWCFFDKLCNSNCSAEVCKVTFLLFLLKVIIPNFTRNGRQ